MRDDCPFNQPMNCPDCGGYNMDCDKHDSNGQVNHHRDPCLWCAHLDLKSQVRTLQVWLNDQVFNDKIGKRLKKLEKQLHDLRFPPGETFDEDDDALGECLFDHYPGDSQ